MLMYISKDKLINGLTNLIGKLSITKPFYIHEFQVSIVQSSNKMIQEM